jgi:hypothetical protein
MQMMMQNLSKNIAKSDILYQNLIENDELSDVVKFFPKIEQSFNFRFRFVQHTDSLNPIKGMSVSYPPDKDGMIETILLGEMPLDELGNINIFRAPIIYENKCGYEDVRVFEKIEELIEEIHRISDYRSPHYVHQN